MKGFVLAAGFGERLRPITDSVPKPLLPVGNLPLIGYALKLLKHHGIDEAIINLHHLGKQIEESLGDGSKYGMKLVYSYEEEILGTGGGLKRMQAELVDGTFVVINGDTVMDVDLGAAIRAHQERGALATLVLRKAPEGGEYGAIEIDDARRIHKILGQGKSDRPLTPMMFAGVHVIEPRLLDYIPPDVDTCINRYAYSKALANGEPLFGWEMEGYWADCGTPDRYLACNADALEQRLSLRHADPLAGFANAPKKDVGTVIRMGTDVELGSDARLVPPVVLGDGARVGDDAVVGPYCVVGARAAIGKQSQVSHAVVLEGSKIESGVQRRGVIIGRKAEAPAQAVQGARVGS